MANWIIDRERCIGCGTCVQLCPSIFAIGDHKVAYVIDEGLAGGGGCAAEAAGLCPQLAIVESDE
jgi:ferredoxin